MVWHRSPIVFNTLQEYNRLALEPIHRPGDNPLPFILIIIVTWNKKKDVLNLLEALSKVDYPPDRFETLLVDNASTDGTVETVRPRHPHVHILQHRENPGGSGGFNAGMRWALTNRPQADYFWLLDNDVLVAPESLRTLVHVLESHPDAAVCGSKILDQQNPENLIEVGAFIDYRRGDIRQNCGDPRQGQGFDSIEEVDYVAACSLLVRTSAVRTVGLLQEDFFIYWDDMEWGARFKACGYRVLASHDSVVFHPSWAGRAADKTVVWRTYYRARNGLCFFNHYCHGLKRRLLLGRMILRFHFLGVSTCLRSETALSEAFSLAVDDFFRGRFGKKNLALPESDLRRFLQTRQSRCVFVFLPQEKLIERAEPLFEQLLDQKSIARICLIAPEGKTFGRRPFLRPIDILTFRQPDSNNIDTIDTMRILSSVWRNREKRSLLITPPVTPRFFSLTGLPIARIDFEKGKTVAIEQFSLRLLLQAPFRALHDVFRALLTTPGRIRPVPGAGCSDPS